MADSVESCRPLNSINRTDRHSLDVLDRSLKVATRVRIPLGLLEILVREFRLVARFHPVHPSVHRVGELMGRVARSSLMKWAVQILVSPP